MSESGQPEQLRGHQSLRRAGHCPHQNGFAHPDQLVTLRCDSISTLLQVATETDAVCLAVYATALDQLASGTLKVLAVAPSLEAPAHYGIVSLAGRTAPPALDLLRSVLAGESRRIQRVFPEC
ncbi:MULTISPECIES: LysR substrate-binding domain-containing protein [Comamonas]|uniref:LysR substrate-binding domain-containing protein n=1 Tax=Comamonas TaxID=283 RepID=UPI0007C47359|nr:LysR substrate-binding domain-containing protein [Comamonas thiooxydans]MCO8251882.1 hypothetical protein [Comamonas thiooxydans]UBQ40908.1 hypothetical protein LCH15_19620 [Comamonas thiooxydans]